MIRYIFFWPALMTLSGCALLLPTKTPSLSWTTSTPNYFRGVFHVHSQFSFDSHASLTKIIEFAEDAQLDFVIITDHNTTAGRQAYLNREYQTKPILIFGNEITTPDGHLVALGVNENPSPTMNSQELIDWIHDQGGAAVIAHPLSEKRPWTNWELQNIDGIEVYNFGHALYAKNKTLLAGKSLFFGPKSFITSNIKLPKDSLQFWDSLLPSARVVAVGATDAHLKLGNVPIMRGMFRLAINAVTLYVQADHLSEKNILKNLTLGNSFIVFESLGVAPNFSFVAISPTTSYHSGQTVTTNAPITFSVKAPMAKKIRLLCNGEIVKQTSKEWLTHASHKPGIFRVEVERKKRLWIISNPIYVTR